MCMNNEEHIWHTKTKLRFIFGGIILLIDSLIFTCLTIPNSNLIWIGVLGLILGFSSLIYGAKDDD